MEISRWQLAAPDIQKETAQHRASPTTEKTAKKEKVGRAIKETFGADKKMGRGESYRQRRPNKGPIGKGPGTSGKLGEAEQSQWLVASGI